MNLYHIFIECTMFDNNDKDTYVIDLNALIRQGFYMHIIYKLII
jgi:hypothetical protein